VRRWMTLASSCWTSCFVSSVRLFTKWRISVDASSMR
jgi:hypothetical protein